MSNEKISSLELVSVISDLTGATKKNATAFMRQFAETIEAALLRDGIVKIKGFGTFKIVWNESRSSVNVQTGERYEIAGHNKISFTPDDEMKDIVNRPYAHLEPVNLDGDAEIQPAAPPEEDPHMKRFSDQATEIVSMIADMQAFRPKKKVTIAEPEPEKPEKEQIIPPATEKEVVAIIETKQSIPSVKTEEIVAEKPVVSESEKPAKEEKMTEQPTEIVSSPVPEEKVSSTITEKVIVQQPISSVKAEETVAETPAPEKIVEKDEKSVLEDELIHRMAEQPSRRSFRWLYISLIIIVLLGGLGAAAYFYGQPLMHWLKEKVHTDSAPAPTAKIVKHVPVPAPQDSMATAQTAPPAEKKPAGDIFSEPRVYNDFLATESAVQGSTLTQIALRYYGNKLFWVYLYEANKDRIRNPEILPPGTKIRIPNLDPRLIDIHNARVLRQASVLQTKYLAQY